MGLSWKKSGNKYNGLDTKPSPFRMIALTTSPVFTFSLLSTKNISLIFSTISISSIIPAIIPKWSKFLRLFGTCYAKLLNKMPV